MSDEDIRGAIGCNKITFTFKVSSHRPFTNLNKRPDPFTARSSQEPSHGNFPLFMISKEYINLEISFKLYSVTVKAQEHKEVFKETFCVVLSAIIILIFWVIDSR